MKTVTITYLTKTKKLKYSKDFKVKSFSEIDEIKRKQFKDKTILHIKIN